MVIVSVLYMGRRRYAGNLKAKPEQVQAALERAGSFITTEQDPSAHPQDVVLRVIAVRKPEGIFIVER